MKNIKIQHGLNESQCMARYIEWIEHDWDRVSCGRLERALKFMFVKPNGEQDFW